MILNNIKRLRLWIGGLNNKAAQIEIDRIERAIAKFVPRDKVVEEVVKRIVERSNIGIEKYGKTLHANNTDDFLQHLQEELLDGANYVQKLIMHREKRDRRVISILEKAAKEYGDVDNHIHDAIILLEGGANE
jgi:hypothetical protein